MTQSGTYDAETASAIRFLLRLWADAAKAKPALVVTADPNSWATEGLEEGNAVLDAASFLPGLRSSILFREERAVSDLMEMFARVGWPREYLVPEFAPDPTSRRRADLAILPPDRGWFMGVELKASLQPKSIDRRFREQQAIWQGTGIESGPQWVCITDGREFIFLDRSGKQLHHRGAPARPELFGVRPEVWPASTVPTTAIESISDLPRLLRELRTQAILVDHTLPHGVRTVSAGARSDLPPGLGPTEEVMAISVHSGVMVVGAVCPPSTLASNSKASLRNTISEHTGIGAVLEVQPRVFSTSLTGAILLCAPNRRHTYFGRLPAIGDLNEFLNSNWFRDLALWLDGEAPPADGFTVTMDVRLPWLAPAQNPELRTRAERLQQLGPTVPLHELCEVFGGSPRPGVPGGDIAVVKGGCLVDGRVDLINADRVAPTLAESDRSWAQPGDVLLSRAFHGHSNISIFDATEPAVLSSNVVCLRLTSKETSPAALREFLSSAAGEALLGQAVSGTVIPHLSLSALRQLRVPALEPELLTNLEETRRLEAQLRARADVFEAQRRQLFDAANLSAFRRQLSELRHQSRVVSASVLSADRLEFVVSNFYPYPLAYGYRMLSSVGDVHQRYASLCQAAENIVAFIASLSMPLLVGDDRAQTDLDLEHKLRGGISPGDWRELARMAGGVLRRYDSNPLAQSLASLDIGSGRANSFGAAIESLVAQINDFKHRRPSEPSEITPRSNAIDIALQLCMDRLSFLTDYPIRYIDRCDEQLNGRFLLDCQRLVGDHPGHPRERIESHRSRVTGALYVEVRPLEWVLLYPFMALIPCPTCHMRETFYFDRASRSGIELKSFERAHTFVNETLDDDLTTWLQS